ncbi:hypothetical protein ACM64Y_19210 [Novispirillum sp. DQ9]|uniref:hypothetical protein n=1 Tax=Novispirillum sp. DQ9 TaxID=3398612 RepID=UPI003C7A4C26
MAHYIVAFDVMGGAPAVDTVTKRIQALGAETAHQLLNTVWYLKTDKSCETIYEHVNTALEAKDRVLVVEASTANFRDLLTSAATLRHDWKDVA